MASKYDAIEFSGEIPGPVSYEFYRDRSYFSGIMGALGSGKTNTTIFKLLNLMAEQEPGQDGVRPSRLITIRNCYDDETEILTESRGWQLFKDLNDNDAVAMLDGDDLVFVVPSLRYRENYDGEMIEYDSEGINFCVTPNHRMWVAKKVGRSKILQNYGWEYARDLFECPRDKYQVRRDANWSGSDYGKPAVLYELLGFFYADGSCYTHVRKDTGRESRHLVFSLTKDRKKKYLRYLLQENGIAFTENGRTFRIGLQTNEGQAVFDMVYDGIGKGPQKAVPQWIKRSKKDCIVAFIEGFLAGDGYRRGGSVFGYTASKQLADDLQEMATKAGGCANITTNDQRGVVRYYQGLRIETKHLSYIVTFVGQKKQRPMLLNKGAKRYKAWTKKKYIGKVYCVEVPTHVVYVRRRGRAFWCQQTYPDLLSTTIKDWQAITGHLSPMKMSIPPEQYLRFRLEDETIVECNVLFIALDRAEHIRKLRGTQATFIWLNEAKELNRAVMEMATRPLGRYPSMALGGVRCTKEHLVADMNAPDEDHWTAEMIENPEEGFSWFVQPGGVIEVGGQWEVNPKAENLRNLPENYYENNLKHKTREWVKVNLANRYGSSIDGKPVYDEFVKDLHVREFEIEEGISILHGEDWGLTPAAVFAQYVDGQLRIFDEVVTWNMSADQLAESMHERKAMDYPNLEWGDGWADPAGTGRSQADMNSPISEFRRHGFNVVGIRTNLFTPRRDSVARLLRKLTMKGEPSLIIHPRCKALAKGMGGHYKFERKRISGDDAFHDVPHKSMYSHVCEALQYLCFGIGDIETARTEYDDPNFNPSIRNRSQGRGWVRGSSRNRR